MRDGASRNARLTWTEILRSVPSYSASRFGHSRVDSAATATRRQRRRLRFGVRAVRGLQVPHRSLRMVLASSSGRPGTCRLGWGHRSRSTTLNT